MSNLELGIFAVVILLITPTVCDLIHEFTKEDQI